jgi:small-conductance mechanosensitive channel
LPACGALSESLNDLAGRVRLLLADLDRGGWLSWVVALGVVVGGTLLLSAVKALFERRLATRAPLTQQRVDDLMLALARRTSTLSLAAVATLAATAVIALPARFESIARAAAGLVCIAQAGVWVSLTIRDVVERRLESATTDGGLHHHQTLVRLATLGLRLVLWTIVVLVALDNLGVNITALVTGLGVGGVAVALATQNILGDLFASVSILLDKPFVPGDFIAVDSHMGTVERIGVKTTRVRALDGEEIVFANGDLLKSRLRNYRSQRERRIQFRVSVSVETPPDVAEKVPALLRAIVERQRPKVRFDRAHLAVLGDGVLVFEIVYVVLEPDYALYMDVQQAINLAILRELPAAGAPLASPTRTVNVHLAPTA